MGNGEGRYLIEWREGGKRLRAAAGGTPAEALEAQRRKRLELEARENNLELLGLPNEEDNILLDRALQNFLRDIKAFRKPLTVQKYEYIVELFCERVAPKKFAREILSEENQRAEGPLIGRCTARNAPRTGRVYGNPGATRLLGQAWTS